jgi:hypothetical protein
LVSEVLVNRNTRFEPGFCSLDSGRSDFLCRTAAFTETGENLSHMLGFDRQDHSVPRANRILDRLDGRFDFTPLELVANNCQFPLTYMYGEFGY